MKSHINDRLTNAVIDLQEPSINMVKHFKGSDLQQDIQAIKPILGELFQTQVNTSKPTLKTINSPFQDTNHWEAELGKRGSIGIYEMQVGSNLAVTPVNTTIDPNKTYALILDASLDGVNKEYQKMWKTELAKNPQLTYKDFMSHPMRDKINGLLLRNGQRLMFQVANCLGIPCQYVQDNQSVYAGSLSYGPPLMVDKNNIQCIQYGNCSSLHEDKEGVSHNIGASFASENFNGAFVHLSPLHGYVALGGNLDAVPLAITPGNKTKEYVKYKNYIQQTYHYGCFCHDDDGEDDEHGYVQSSICTCGTPVPNALRLENIPSTHVIRESITQLMGNEGIIFHYKPIACCCGQD